MFVQDCTLHPWLTKAKGKWPCARVSDVASSISFSESHLEVLYLTGGIARDSFPEIPSPRPRKCWRGLVGMRCITDRYR